MVGEPGGLSLRITERSERFGAVLDISIRYPDLGLGLELQTTRSLQAVFGGATLPGFDHYRPVARTRAVPSAFFEALFEHAPPSAELRLSDEELGLRVPLHDDGFEHLVDEVLRAVARTERVATAIGALPFPADVPPAAQAAWRACAATSRAVLVPSVPSLSGFAFPRVTPAQEERTLTATLITVREREVMRDRVYVYLDASRLPERTLGPLLNGVYPPGLARVRETFPRMHATSNGEVITLERDTWSPDPRLLLPALEAVVDWVLVERGELRSGLPYR